MIAKEKVDNEEYEKQRIKVEQTIQCMHLTDVQYDTLSCYMAGMNFEAIVKLHGVIKSTVWNRRQKVKNKYIKYILNGECPF